MDPQVVPGSKSLTAVNRSASAAKTRSSPRPGGHVADPVEPFAPEVRVEATAVPVRDGEGEAVFELLQDGPGENAARVARHRPFSLRGSASWLGVRCRLCVEGPAGGVHRAGRSDRVAPSRAGGGGFPRPDCARGRLRETRDSGFLAGGPAAPISVAFSWTWGCGRRSNVCSGRPRGVRDTEFDPIWEIPVQASTLTVAAEMTTWCRQVACDGKRSEPSVRDRRSASWFDRRRTVRRGLYALGFAPEPDTGRGAGRAR